MGHNAGKVYLEGRQDVLGCREHGRLGERFGLRRVERRGRFLHLAHRRSKRESRAIHRTHVDVPAQRHRKAAVVEAACPDDLVYVVCICGIEGCLDGPQLLPPLQRAVHSIPHRQQVCANSRNVAVIKCSPTTPNHRVPMDVHFLSGVSPITAT
jgi:hypothetical protein